MKNLFSSISLFVLLSAFSQEDKVYQVSDKQQQLIDETLKEYPAHTEISVAVIDKGQVFYTGYQKNLEGELIKTDNQKTVFEIGSITKVFTSTLLCQLITEGKVKADDPISKYLKFKLKDKPKITFQQLANHTSGLPRLPSDFLRFMNANPQNPYIDYSDEDLKKYLTQDLKLNSEPGATYAYSNLGTGLLAYTMRKMTGKSYEELLQELIFRTLNMNSTTSNRLNVKGNLAQGQSKEGVSIPNWDFSALAGAGAILSTTEDLTKFALANFDLENPVYKKLHEKTFSISEYRGIAYGWHINEEDAASPVYQHNGATGGYSSCMALDLKAKNGIIILSTVSHEHPKRQNIDQLCFSLLELLKVE